MTRERLFTITIKDCRVDTFRCGGHGGQNQNKRDTGVRITHLPSGAVGESREERSQLLNKRRAFGRMAGSKQFQSWVKVKAAELSLTEPIERRVDRAMQSGNIRCEVHDAEGRWVAAMEGV